MAATVPPGLCVYEPQRAGKEEKLLRVLLLKVKEGQRDAEQGMGMAQAH